MESNAENVNAVNENETKQELDLDELDQVTGGGMRNTHKTRTVNISQDTENKI